MLGQEAFLRQQIAAYFESEGHFSLQGKSNSAKAGVPALCYRVHMHVQV